MLDVLSSQLMCVFDRYILEMKWKYTSLCTYLSSNNYNIMFKQNWVDFPSSW